MTLIIRGATPTNVFQLNGVNENSATYALGWVLERSSDFRNLFGEYIFGPRVDMSEAVVSLQKHGDDKGFTDIEISVGAKFHCVLEAKRSWKVPTEAQLRKYCPRLDTSGAKVQRLVSISSADSALAERSLPKSVDGIRVTHLSWRGAQLMAQRAHALTSKFEDKMWLRHLMDHLKEFVALERITDNTVFVASLSRKRIRPDHAYAFIDVVRNENRYFHPVGNGYPARPPNYVAFRYDGKLQGVHHVESFMVTGDLSTINPLWPTTDVDHFIYELGPAMLPAKEIRTGDIYRSGKVYCAIDTLLSGQFPTISEACKETKRRLNGVE